jgi:hypothetical protein
MTQKEIEGLIELATGFVTLITLYFQHYLENNKRQRQNKRQRPFSRSLARNFAIIALLMSCVGALSPLVFHTRFGITKKGFLPDIWNPAETDGIVIAWADTEVGKSGLGGPVNIAGYAGPTKDDNGNKVAANSVPGKKLHGIDGALVSSIMFPVKKGDFWKVTYGGEVQMEQITWMPIDYK